MPISNIQIDKFLQSLTDIGIDIEDVLPFTTIGTPDKDV